MRKMKRQITYGFSIRDDGDMRQEHVVSGFLSSKGLDKKNLITAQQVHGTTVESVTDNVCGTRIAGADALFYQDTASSHTVVLGIRTADCIPVLLYDPENLLIAAVHSGWRGTLGEITTNVITEFEKKGSPASRIHCVIGPHIRSCCYSVPGERATLFTSAYGNNTVKSTSHQQFLDLTAVVYQQLKSKGVQAQHIRDDQHCTSCSIERYYSYRKDSKETFGEMLGFIAVLR